VWRADSGWKRLAWIWAIAAAVASNHLGRKCLANTLALGELGLNGELRTIPQVDARLKEAPALWASKPRSSPSPCRERMNIPGMDLKFVKKLAEAFEFIYQS